jgi:hypothetical protein
MNLAWNRLVLELIDSGAYDRYLNYDQERICVTFFGTAPGLCWNGGRAEYMIPSVSDVALVEHVRALNERRIGFLFVYNNTGVTQASLSDGPCNAVLSRCRSSLNGVVVANERLRNHLRMNYPEYVLHASSILGYRCLDDFAQLYDKYDVVVLPDDLNADAGFLRSLTYPERTEILLNCTCMYRCPHRDEHLRFIEEENTRAADNLPPRAWRLPCRRTTNKRRETENRQYISPGRLGRFAESGFKRFKFLDRTMRPDLVLLEQYWRRLESVLEESSVP